MDGIDEDPARDDDGLDGATRLMRHTVAQLAEHFESVLVLTIRPVPNGGGTMFCHRSAGNTFANHAAAREYVMMCDVYSRENSRRRMDEE